MLHSARQLTCAIHLNPTCPVENTHEIILQHLSVFRLELDVIALLADIAFAPPI